MSKAVVCFVYSVQANIGGAARTVPLSGTVGKAVVLFESYSTLASMILKGYKIK